MTSKWKMEDYIYLIQLSLEHGIKNTSLISNDAYFKGFRSQTSIKRKLKCLKHDLPKMNLELLLDCMLQFKGVNPSGSYGEFVSALNNSETEMDSNFKFMRKRNGKDINFENEQLSDNSLTLGKKLIVQPFSETDSTNIASKSAILENDKKLSLEKENKLQRITSIAKEENKLGNIMDGTTINASKKILSCQKMDNSTSSLQACSSQIIDSISLQRKSKKAPKSFENFLNNLHFKESDLKIKLKKIDVDKFCFINCSSLTSNPVLLDSETKKSFSKAVLDNLEILLDIFHKSQSPISFSEFTEIFIDINYDIDLLCKAFL